MGITLAVFRQIGYIPEEKERLKISTSCVKISFFSNFNILVGTLFGPEDLLSLSEDIMEIKLLTTFTNLLCNGKRNNMSFV